MRNAWSLLLVIATIFGVALGGAASVEAQVAAAASTLRAAEPDIGEDEGPAPLDRVLVLSIGLGAGVSGLSRHVAVYDEEENRYDAVEVRGGSRLVGDLIGYAGLVVDRVADGQLEHAVGYQPHVTFDGTGAFHRHLVAYRADSRIFGFTAGIGLGVLTPFAGNASAASLSLGIGLHVYFAGPFFVELDFAGDAVGGGSFMKTYSLAIGIANL